MARKKKEAITAAPDQTLLADKISAQVFIDSMRRLMGNQDYQLLRRQWLTLRIGILNAGKEKPSVDAWSVLKGFDEAIVVAEKWATRQTGSDLMKQRQAEVLAALNGGK